MRGTIILLAILGLLYLFLFSLSTRGYGYAGYGGHRDDRGYYHGMHGPSFFYFGGASFYGGDSVRGGSIGGSGSSGGGPRSGK